MKALFSFFSLISVVASLAAKPIEISTLDQCQFYDRAEELDIASAWTQRGDVLVCDGEPHGYLALPGEYEDFALSFQWRWPEGTEGGNSGVLIYTIPNLPGHNQWAQSLEIQLHRDQAGDFWVIGNGVAFLAQGSVFKPRGVPVTRVDRADGVQERSLGEWNQMVIVSHAGTVTVVVNGEVANRVTGVEPRRGLVAFQSEGAPIEFRDIVLAPVGAEDAH